MRNLHLHVLKEFGQENVAKLWKWEKIEKKMVEYSNHRRFSLRCLSKDLTPVSVRLKCNIKTSRDWQIIRRAQRQLLSEHIISINNTLDLHMDKREAYIRQLDGELGQTTMEECKELIKRIIEARHKRVLECQSAKFEKLWEKQCTTVGHSNAKSGHSKHHEQRDRNNPSNILNTTRTTRSWVKNLSGIPLTKAQEHLLAHGPNFAIVPECLPNG